MENHKNEILSEPEFEKYFPMYELRYLGLTGAGDGIKEGSVALSNVVR